MALKIIGAGLGRTGTASLKVAFEQLGFGPCYHMGEVLPQAQERVPLWIEAGKGKPDWDAIFDGYQSATDYPSCTFWREQMNYYPEAKVVLSTRSPESWFASVNTTIMSESVNGWLRSDPMMKEFFELCVWRDFEKHILDRPYMENYFRERNKAIAADISDERLLVFDVRDGWEPLCKFLEVPVPDTGFPRVNSRDETRKLLDTMIASQTDEDLRRNMREQSDNLFRSDKS
jgi:hypothetical protein